MLTEISKVASARINSSVLETLLKTESSRILINVIELQKKMVEWLCLSEIYINLCMVDIPSYIPSVI